MANTEDELLALIVDVTALAAESVIWATDPNRGGAALLISLLQAHDQMLLYIPGRAVHHASAGYRGDGKKDAKDAAVIADQARIRHDLSLMRSGEGITDGLRILTAHRADLVADRTRAFNRMRATLLEYFPALEAAFDFANTKAAVALLTKYQTVAQPRRSGAIRIAGWLATTGHVKGNIVAETALAAAKSQRAVIASQDVAAVIVASLAAEILRLHDQISVIDASIEELLRQHEHAQILLTVPAMGPRPATEFLAVVDEITHVESPDRLAAIAGLAPLPRDSGKISGNHHRPHRYNRQLLRACYLSAQSAARYSPTSASYYARKRAEGKSHKQAVPALTRRRINVIWAKPRDGTTYTPPSTQIA